MEITTLKARLHWAKAKSLLGCFLGYLNWYSLCSAAKIKEKISLLPSLLYGINRPRLVPSDLFKSRRALSLQITVKPKTAIFRIIKLAVKFSPNSSFRKWKKLTHFSPVDHTQRQRHSICHSSLCHTTIFVILVLCMYHRNLRVRGGSRNSHTGREHQSIIWLIFTENCWAWRKLGREARDAP